MCINFFSLNSHPNYSLVMASNRDEFYDRPASPLSWWANNTKILAGKDDASVVGKNGTWLGANNTGGFSAITNIRAPNEKNIDLRSRGELTIGYLESGLKPEQYVSNILKSINKYNGFNLLIGQVGVMKPAEILWLTNRSYDLKGFLHNHICQKLSPGIYGLSNASLDTPWPKVTSGTAKFSMLLKRDTGAFTNPDAYFDLLSNEDKHPYEKLPKTGVSKEWEELLSSIFIRSDSYGTRASSLLRVKHNGEFQFIERRYDAKGYLGNCTIDGQFR